jgi:hypothetical protein
LPVGGGEEIEVVGERVDAFSWALSRAGIYFATARETVRRRGEEYTIHVLDFASGRVTELRRDEGPFSRWCLAVSPDEKWILYGEMPAWESELMLAEDFR